MRNREKPFIESHCHEVSIILSSKPSFLQRWGTLVIIFIMAFVTYLCSIIYIPNEIADESFSIQSISIDEVIDKGVVCKVRETLIIDGVEIEGRKKNKIIIALNNNPERLKGNRDNYVEHYKAELLQDENRYQLEGLILRKHKRKLYSICSYQDVKITVYNTTLLEVILTSIRQCF